jgi:hypothetical protein
VCFEMEIPMKWMPHIINTEPVGSYNEKKIPKTYVNIWSHMLVQAWQDARWVGPVTNYPKLRYGFCIGACHITSCGIFRFLQIWVLATKGPPKVGASTITKYYVGLRQPRNLAEFFKDYLPPSDFLCVVKLKTEKCKKVFWGL